MSEVAMTECSYSEQVSAYHDGELDAASGAVIERHLDSCPPCADRLAELRGMSRLFAATTLPHLSQIGMHRLHSRLDALIDGGLVRLARVMTGIAAAVLLVGSLWLIRSQPAPVASNPARASSVVAMVLQTEESIQQPAVEAGPNDWIVQELDR